MALASLLFVFKKGHEVSLGLGPAVALRYYQARERILKKAGDPK
jgi:hypothetical protein